MNAKAKVANSLQGTESKGMIRSHVWIPAIHEFAGKVGTVNYVGLPSTFWVMESNLAQICRKGGGKCGEIIGVENDPKVAPLVASNKPRKARLHIMDFDAVVCSEISLASNVVNADYCGNPFKFIGKNKGGCNADNRYTYPQIDAFVDFATKAVANGKPSIYFLTFRMNARAKHGGHANIIRAMGGPDCKQMPQAITGKIATKLSAAGLTGKVKRIAKVIYHGDGRSYMICLGYAINFDLDFSINADWTDGQNKYSKQSKARKSSKSGVKVAYNKSEIKAAWDNANPEMRRQNPKRLRQIIAESMGISTMTVSAVLSWHCNPESFSKKEQITA